MFVAQINNKNELFFIVLIHKQNRNVDKILLIFFLMNQNNF